MSSEASTTDILRVVRPSASVRELTADKLREAIVSGAVQPGERLVEPTLAKRMDGSRPTLREALTQLVAERLVVLAPNRGFSVATISWADAQEIYHVRGLIEGEAAYLYAKVASANDIVMMDRALQDFSEALAAEDARGLVRSTSDFYRVFLEGCGNRTLVDLLHSLVARISFLRARSMSRPGRANHSLAEMRELLRSFKNGDSEGARAASHQHIRAAAAAAKESFHSTFAA